MAAAVSPHSFGLEDARNALTEVLESFKIPDNESRIEAAREKAGNDMLKTMQLVFPLLTQMQMSVIERYGFTPDGDGIVRFTQMVKLYEKQDLEIAALNGELRSIIIPQMVAPQAGQPTET